MKLKAVLKDVVMVRLFKKKLNSSRPLRIAFVAIFLWSTQAVCMGLGTRLTDFSAILFPAFITSSLFLFLFKVLHDGKDLSCILVPFSKNMRQLLIGGSMLFGSQFFFYYGLQIGPKVETNLTNYLWPLIFIVLGYLFLSERFMNSEKGKKILRKINTFIGNGPMITKPERIECDWLRISKLILGFVGVGLLLTNGNIQPADWRGPVFGFVAGLLWAIFSVYLRFLDRVSYVTSFVGGATILSGIAWAFRGYPKIWPTILIAIYLGLFPLGLAMLAWERALKNGRTQDIGALSFLAPLFSTVFLFLFKIDKINNYFLIGGSLVVFANINFRDIGDKIKNYLEEQENLKINSDLTIKSIWKRIQELVILMRHDHSVREAKIIIYYLVVIFFIAFRKWHIPLLRY